MYITDGVAGLELMICKLADQVLTDIAPTYGR